MIQDIERIKSFIEEEYCIREEGVLGVFELGGYLGETYPVSVLIVTNKRLIRYWGDDSQLSLEAFFLRFVCGARYEADRDLMVYLPSSEGVSSAIFTLRFSLAQERDKEQVFKLIMRNSLG